MLQWDWPSTWDPEVLAQIRAELQRHLQRAISRAPPAMARGRVDVEELALGSTPPVVAITAIRELSASSVALHARVRYEGNAVMVIRGIEVNLATVQDSGGEFFMPIRVRLSGIVIDGMFSIEYSQAIEPTGQEVSTALLPREAMAMSMPGAAHPPQHDGGQSRSATGPARNSSARSFVSAASFVDVVVPLSASASSFAQYPPPPALPRAPSVASTAATAGVAAPGFGMLFATGGRRSMKPPQAVTAAAGAQSAAGTAAPSSLPTAPTLRTSGSLQSMTTGPQHAPSPTDSAGSSGQHFTFADIAEGRAAVQRRTLRVQCFDDPLRSFHLETNVGATMEGADAKVEGVVRQLLRPMIESLKSPGLVFEL